MQIEWGTCLLSLVGGGSRNDIDKTVNIAVLMLCKCWFTRTAEILLSEMIWEVRGWHFVSRGCITHVTPGPGELTLGGKSWGNETDFRKDFKSFKNQNRHSRQVKLSRKLNWRSQGLRLIEIWLDEIRQVNSTKLNKLAWWNAN